MKPSPFEYRRPNTLDEALSLLAEHGDDAKVLAGGQSLISLLNFRLAHPALLVDIGQLTKLQEVDRTKDKLSIGPMVTHHSIERAADDPRFGGYGALPRTAEWIGHLPIRTRGTFGGSVVHGDPTAEWPLLCSALDARLTLMSETGTRTVPVDDFYVGFLTTCMAADELLVGVQFDRPPMGASLTEFSRRRGDFAIVAVAASLEWSSKGHCTGARITVGGVDSIPLRVPDAERVLLGQPLDHQAMSEAATVAATSVAPTSDMHGSSQYRRHLVRVLAERALTEAYGGVAA